MRFFFFFILMMFTAALHGIAQPLQPITPKEALPAADAKAKSVMGGSAYATNVLFLGVEYQGVSLSMDLATGKATGWLFRYYLPSADSVQYFVAVSLPIVGVQAFAVPLDTITRALPFNVVSTALTDPWVDSPEALAGSKNGGAQTYLAAHGDARISLAVLVNNPVANPVLPFGEYWMFVYTATGDTLTCLVYADTGDPLRCGSSNAPKITSAPRSTARVGELYSYDADARGEPAPHFMLVKGPSGMTIDSLSGLVSWTPTAGQVGTQNVTVRAGNANGTDEQAYQIQVEALANAPKFQSLPPLETRAGDPYQYQLAASGSPRPVFELLSPPAGMIVDGGRGIVMWSPSRAQAGTHAVAIVARNTAGADTQRYTLAVVCEPRLQPIAKQIMKVGETLTVPTTADGYPAPRFALVITPAGMTIDSLSGVIAWTPTAQQTGTHNVVAEARNRLGFQPQGFTVTVDPATAAERVPRAGDFALGAVYPHPASGPVSIAITGSAELRVTARVTDLAGRVVRRMAPVSGHAIAWDLRDDNGRAVPSGVYLVEARAGAVMRVRRVVVEEGAE
ncbi:MAG: putative Ig domain-containing protein [Ignavibacteria bacterium]|nr:putative Ig domain-containing protein [Ignavibacteria bacterium]